MPNDTPIKDKLFPATAMPDADWWQALWPEPMAVLETIGLEKGMTAIDLCCGDGLFTAPLSTLLDGAVYAVDLDPAMLKQAQQAIKQEGAPMCHFIEGDARDMTRLLPGPVDAVIIANTFHGIPEQTEMAKNVYRVLNPDGRLIIINWHVLPREKTTVLGLPRGPRLELRMSPDDVCSVVEPAGLKFSETVQLPPYHYAAIFKKT